MNTNEYFNKMKNIEEKLLNFLDNEGHDEENHENIFQILKDENNLTNQYDLKIILYLINRITNDHHRYPNFLNKIFQILKMIKNEIQKYYSNDQLFKIFKTNKRILLFLIEEQIFHIDYSIYQEMMKEKYQKMQIPEYFSYEIKTFIDKEERIDEFFPSYSDDEEYYELNFSEKIQKILKEDFSNFNEKRKQGENDSYLCEIIRKDLIEEFIIYVNKESYPLDSYITKSIFETNELLMKQSRTKLIEYAAFFGSTQIFRFLCKNGVKMTSKIWIYAVHGCDEEIIHHLEDNIDISETFIKQILKESIKIHHSYITYYIEDNLLNKKETTNDEIILNCLKYYNFINFDIDKVNNNDNNLFNYACKYDYYAIAEFFLKTKKIESDNTPFKFAANKNNSEIISLLISKTGNEIRNDCFGRCRKLKQITIPSSVTSIGESAFSGCTSLTQITIPSSVTEIGDSAFIECLSLTQITIPSSVTDIGESAFWGCSSLTQITFEIPSSVTYIGDGAFWGCSSIKKITIPSSITEIGESIFYECSSLTHIDIPSSVTDIGESAFWECSSLTQITIPSSVIKIGDYAFYKCSSLTQITIPSSVTDIGDSAFCGCSSLTQISFELPSSLTLFKSSILDGCSSLTLIKIPSSVQIDGAGLNSKVQILRI